MNRCELLLRNYIRNTAKYSLFAPCIITAQVKRFHAIFSIYNEPFTQSSSQSTIFQLPCNHTNAIHRVLHSYGTANNCASVLASSLVSPFCVVHNRHKHSKSKKKGGSTQEEEEEESDTEDDTIDDLGRDFKDIIAHVNSLRIDGIIKAGLGISKSKVEDAFYEGRLRLNGVKAQKKSMLVSIGDEVDWVKGRNIDNPDFTDISRIVLLEVSDTASGIGKTKVKVRRFKSLVVDTYND